VPGGDAEGNAVQGGDAAEADRDVLDLEKRWIDGNPPGAIATCSP
jgi:hypothetical protein